MILAAAERILRPELFTMASLMTARRLANTAPSAPAPRRIAAQGLEHAARADELAGLASLPGWMTVDLDAPVPPPERHHVDANAAWMPGSASTRRSTSSVRCVFNPRRRSCRHVCTAASSAACVEAVGLPQLKETAGRATRRCRTSESDLGHDQHVADPGASAAGHPARAFLQLSCRRARRLRAGARPKAMPVSPATPWQQRADVEPPVDE